MQQVHEGDEVTIEMDEDVLAKILGAPPTKEGQEQAKAEVSITTRPFDVPDGWSMFSDVFWKPTQVPDFPVPHELEWSESSSLYIPESDMERFNSWPKKETELFCFAMYNDDTTLTWGPTGSGKTELGKAICARLKVPWYRINCDREQSKADIIGSPILEYDGEGKQYIKLDPTPVTDCIRGGGMLVLDESFRSPSLMVLQSLLEKTSRTLIIPDAPGMTEAERILKPKPNRFWMCLTDNTQGAGSSSGAYISEVQDWSTLDRISSTIFVDYPALTVERKMLTSLYPEIDKTTIEKLIKFAHKVRTSFKEGTMSSTFSLRASMAVCEKAVYIGSIEESLRISWFNKLMKEDEAKAKDMFHQVFASVL